MPVTEIKSKSQFDKFINNGKKDSVIDYHALWCGPCKAVAPTFDAMASQYKNVDFGRLDVDAVPEVAQSQSVTAMPTFVVYQSNGKEKGRVVGADVNALKKHLTGGKAPVQSTGYVLGSGKKVGSEPMSESTQQLIILAGFIAVLMYFYYFK